MFFKLRRYTKIFYSQKIPKNIKNKIEIDIDTKKNLYWIFRYENIIQDSIKNEENKESEKKPIQDSIENEEDKEAKKIYIDTNKNLYWIFSYENTIQGLIENEDKESKKQKISGFFKNLNSTYWQTWILFLSFLFTIIIYLLELKKQQFENNVIKSIENINLLRIKSIFRELVINIDGKTIDLSKIVEHPDQKTHPNKKMREIDFLLTSKGFRKNDEVKRFIHSIIYTELLVLQFALSCLKRENVKVYDSRYFKARTGLKHFILYLKTCDNEVTNDLFKLIEPDTYVWAIDLFYEKKDRSPEVQGVYNKLKEFKKIKKN